MRGQAPRPRSTREKRGREFTDGLLGLGVGGQSWLWLQEGIALAGHPLIFWGDTGRWQGTALRAPSRYHGEATKISGRSTGWKSALLNIRWKD